MRLWTIQKRAAYETMLRTGALVANEEHLMCAGEMDSCRPAYDWMVGKMIEKGLPPPEGIRYPIWAWYQWEGKRRRRDLRTQGYRLRGTKMVQLTIDVPDESVLLSDFSLFHCPLNYWYLSLSEADDLDFQREYTAGGFAWEDLQDFDIRSEAVLQLRKRIVESWECVFDLEREDDWTFGHNEKKCIQATLWRVTVDQVKKAEFFIAK